MIVFIYLVVEVFWGGGLGELSWYNDSLRAGQSGNKIPVGVRFSAPVQAGPGAHPAPCTMGTGSLSWVLEVAMTTHSI